MSGKPEPAITDLNRPYFEGTAMGELRIRHCPQCGAHFRFAHALCPQCWSESFEWRVASGRAEICAFSVVHQPPSPAFAEDLPYVLALVSLEEGVTMMTNIQGADPAGLRVGMKVKVAFENRGESVLPVFIPA